MPGIACRRAAKCFGESANQYTMINFHLPPIAASAAVSGHPPTGLRRPRRVWLPSGAFLMELHNSDYSPARQRERSGCPNIPLEVINDSRSPKLQDQAGSPRGVHRVLRNAVHTSATL